MIQFCRICITSCAFIFITLLCSFSARCDIPLHGQWKFKSDPQDRGIIEKWYGKVLPETITLPGSMAGNLKGDDITLKTKWTGSIYDSSFYFNPRLAKYRQPGNIKIPFWLTPLKHYVGAAWYQKEVTIPKNWAGQRIVLHLERAHTETRVWLDNKEVGMQNSLVAAHEYDLTSYLTPGKHRITIRVDNRIKEINVGPDSHSITDHTQGNWNGLIGKMALVATSPVYLEDIQIYPDLTRRSAKVKMLIRNKSRLASAGKIDIFAKSFNTSAQHQTKLISANYIAASGDTAQIELDLPFGEGMLTWDEFDPALYMLNSSLQSNSGAKDQKQVQFGMREFTIKEGAFLINGRPVFLRGTLNNCEFPLTGYPATDVPSWERIYKIARAHGLNHMRFHSWCPPEAAFIAADKVGFYLQPEGPSWTNHGPKLGLGQPIDKYLYDETNRMAKNYGNYASFTMLSAGNEPAGNQVQYLNAFVDYWKARDSRRVYTGMSVGGSWPVVPNAEFQVRAGAVRGLNWNGRPESMSDYSTGISSFKVPFVAHEMGQWCAFPDFKEIKKYTGIYRAKNFELFQEELKDRGMADQAEDFLIASGKLQALCYKNEIEKALRTPGYDGFQLLGLQDFPGQGTALVGVLNAFWDEKGYISAKQFSRFCNSTVPLAEFPKFVFSNSDSLNVNLKMFHSGKAAFQNAEISWKISDLQGKVHASGKFSPQTIGLGNGIFVGRISLPLSFVSSAGKLNLEVGIDNTPFVNDWNFWVYPSQISSPQSGIYYTTQLDDEAKEVLDKGGKVFLNASGKVVKGKEVAMHFLPVFWNTSWFKMRPPHVTGMLIQSKSPAFAGFPTDSYSDIQWWEIANRAQVMVLEDFPKGFKPLVQPIDTWFLNRRLALIYEAKVGNGKLIVSSADLRHNLDDKPAARQLFASLQKYMLSDKFNPEHSLSFEVVKDVFLNQSRESFDTFTKDSPDELKPNSSQNKPKK